MSTAIYDCREAAGEEQSSGTVLAAEEVAAGPARFRDIVFSLSLANLCFLMVWQMATSLAGDEATKYFEMVPPSFGFVAALLADIFVLASLIYLLLQTRRRFSRWRAVSSVALSGICCFALLEMEQLIQQQFESHTLLIIVITAALMLLALIFVPRTRAVTKVLVMLLSPLLPLLTVDAAWLYSRPELKHLQTQHVAGKLASVSSHRRLIWIIFDELDYHLAFEVRPSRLKMPEFDRLRDVSLSADRAHSPAFHTILSLPSLLTGRPVVAEKHRANDIALRFAGTSQWNDLSEQPTIFRRMRAAGFNTAISGWHHPYCRVIGKDLSDCATAPNGTDPAVFYDAVGKWPFFGRAVAIALWEAESLPIARTVFGRSCTFLRFHSLRGGARPSTNSGSSSSIPLCSYANIRNVAVREQQISAAKCITENAVRMARDPELNFILIHAPSPHLPGIWNSQSRQFSAIGPSDYVDNLGFVDFALGEIRQALEQTGNWDQTTLLVSADHPFRLSVWQPTTLWTPELAAITQGKQAQRVPFILKLPGQTKPLPYHRDFNTVVTGDLIWEILNGNIRVPEQAARWLDSH